MIWSLYESEYFVTMLEACFFKLSEFIIITVNWRTQALNEIEINEACFSFFWGLLIFSHLFLSWHTTLFNSICIFNTFTYQLELKNVQFNFVSRHTTEMNKTWKCRSKWISGKMDLLIHFLRSMSSKLLQNPKHP